MNENLYEILIKIQKITKLWPIIQKHWDQHMIQLVE